MGNLLDKYDHQMLEMVNRQITREALGALIAPSTLQKIAQIVIVEVNRSPWKSVDTLQ